MFGFHPMVRSINSPPSLETKSHHKSERLGFPSKNSRQSIYVNPGVQKKDSSHPSEALLKCKCQQKVSPLRATSERLRALNAMAFLVICCSLWSMLGTVQARGGWCFSRPFFLGWFIVFNVAMLIMFIMFIHQAQTYHWIQDGMDGNYKRSDYFFTLHCYSIVGCWMFYPHLG